MSRDRILILMADDDEEDCLLTRDALSESGAPIEFATVPDGEQLLAYLRNEGPYAAAPRPQLVLLDLNMPRLDGREALRAIKSDPALRAIPVVVLTTSRAEEDVVRSYQLAANSYISKPVTFAGLVRVMKSLGHYWFDIVDLPGSRANRGRV